MLSTPIVLDFPDLCCGFWSQLDVLFHGTAEAARIEVRWHAAHRFAVLDTFQLELRFFSHSNIPVNGYHI